MPQQERNKKAATKALAKAASKPGQLKLTSLFAVESESQPSTSRNADETTVAEEGPQSQTNENVHMEMVWVKCADDFTDVDKERSERSGRYFRREWFESYTWLVYNREKNKAFCETCATYQSDGMHKGVFGNYEVGFWCLSNHEDFTHMCIFFRYVKKNCGTLSPTWFMSDLASQSTVPGLA